MNIKLTILLLLLVILAGCKKDKKSNTQPAVKNQNVLNTNAHLIDTSTINSSTTSTITLNKSSMSFMPAVGDILIAPPSARDTLGLFVKILSVNNNGNTVSCTTTTSNLNEAFKELHIDYTYNGPYAINASANLKSPRLQLNRHARASVPGSTIDIAFDKNIAQGLEFSGNLNLNIPDTKIKYVKMAGALLPDTVLISADFNTNGSELEITGTALQLNQINLQTINLPTFTVPVPVGPVIVPIPFTQKIKLNLLPATLSGKLKFKVLPTVSATLGVSYENGTWNNLSTFSIAATADTLIKNNVDDCLTLTATVFDPVYEITPLGSDALNMFFEIPNDLSLNVQSGTPNYTLNYSLNVNAGVNASFWDGLVSGTYALKATLYEHTILQDNFNIKIGDHAYGGIVFYVDKTGKHGLVVDSVDLAKNFTIALPQDNSSTSFDADATIDNNATDYGLSSTKLITENNSSDALLTQICTSYNISSLCSEYNDWFLPSINALQLLYQAKDIVKSPTSGIYWSSSYDSPGPNLTDVVTDHYLYLLSFNTGAVINSYLSYDTDTGPGLLAGNIRAIRAF